MARTVDPARQHARRQQIIHAAAELFATRGFAGTTTTEICRAAGMSSGNVFHYFRSKRDIFYAVLRYDENEKAERLATAQHSDDPWTALLDVVDLLVAPATQPFGPALVMTAMIQATHDAELAAWLDEDDAAERAALQTLVTRAIRANQIDPGLDAGTVASWISAMISAFYFQALSDSGFRPANEIQTLRIALRRFLRAAPAHDHR